MELLAGTSEALFTRGAAECGDGWDGLPPTEVAGCLRLVSGTRCGRQLIQKRFGPPHQLLDPLLRFGPLGLKLLQTLINILKSVSEPFV